MPLWGLALTVLGGALLAYGVYRLVSWSLRDLDAEPIDTGKVPPPVPFTKRDPWGDRHRQHFRRPGGRQDGAA